MESRRLSYDELLVLRLVQAHYGPHNTIADIVVTPAAEASIIARDAAGHACAAINLTMLGASYRAGALSLDALRAWIAGGHAS